jgi:UDP-N-acetylglucosamine 1-carboxyvinyltransferase
MASHDRFRVFGGTPLRGEVTISGAKNSVLKLMAASLLATGKTTITNVPEIADVDIMADLLTRLGCTVVRGQSQVSIDVPQLQDIALIMT